MMLGQDLPAELQHHSGCMRLCIVVANKPTTYTMNFAQDTRMGTLIVAGLGQHTKAMHSIWMSFLFAYV